MDESLSMRIRIKFSIVVGLTCVLLGATAIPLVTIDAATDQYDTQLAAKKLGTWIGVDVYVAFSDPNLAPNSGTWWLHPLR